jgi:membrane associated rhomboid family serine protease
MTEAATGVVTVKRERIFNLPGSVVAIVAVLVGIQAIRAYLLSEVWDDWLLTTFAFVPGRLTYIFDPAGVADTFSTMTGPFGRAQEEVARTFLGDGRPQWWTLLTYALLHAGWLHVLVNSLWLAAFGAPVARRFGTVRFLLLLVVTAAAGALMHYATHRFDLMPVVGASASVSGAMAAAARFVFQPLAPLGEGAAFGSGASEAYRQPALPLLRVFTNARTLPFLIVWFGANLLFGISSAPLGITDGPIAWEAHVGGFLAGLLLFPLFDPPAAAPVVESEILPPADPPDTI